MHRLLRWAAVVLAVCAMTASCMEILATDARVTPIGRAARNETQGSLAFDWSDVGLTLQPMTLENGTLWVVMDGQNNEFTMLVNDQKLSHVVSTNTEKQTYTLLTDVPAGTTVRVSMVKRTEALVGMVTVYAFGGIESFSTAPEEEIGEKQRKIRVLGDSITCGYGDLGTGPCPFTPQTQDGLLTYAMLAAEHFHAQPQVQCISGIGLLHNYGDPRVYSQRTLPFYLNRTIASQPQPVWDPSQFLPDVLVVNIGTNDFSNPKVAPDADLWVSTYHRVLQRMRDEAQNQDLPAALCCGPMIHDPCCSYVQRVVQEEQAAGHPVAYVDMQGIDHTGCGTHPNVTQHAQMFERLEPVLQHLTGWT